MIKDSGDDEVDHVIDGLRMVVKSGGGRNHNCTPLGKFVHVLQMNGGVRCLSRNNDQFPPFFQSHDGRASDEVVTNPCAEFSKRGSRTRAKNNSIDVCRARGRFSANVSVVF